jgi:hypothetical protein
MPGNQILLQSLHQQQQCFFFFLAEDLEDEVCAPTQLPAGLSIPTTGDLEIMRTRNTLVSLIYVIIHVCIVTPFQHKAPLLNPLRFYAGLATSAVVAKTIALTRERFANDKLKSQLLGLPCYELPCIDFVATVNAQELYNLLQSHDQIVITSPQSAAVFVSAWTELDKPTVSVISVGEGTSKPLRDAGIVPVFTPSDSTALTLAKELPFSPGMRVLYPTSSIADGRLVAGLQERGFEVTSP